MPYISKEQRERLNTSYDGLSTLCALDLNLRSLNEEQIAGALNYIVTYLMKRYLEKGTTYNKINSLIGALECAKLELYRKIAAFHEDKKLEINGSV